jgi:hypothetical protein
MVGCGFLMGQDLIIYDPPARMTEREARIAGATSNRLLNLRGFLSQGVRGGSLTVSTKNGGQSQTLTQDELEALIALLIERDEALLIGLNIEIEK